jgi:hypothetical protein
MKSNQNKSADYLRSGIHIFKKGTETLTRGADKNNSVKVNSLRHSLSRRPKVALPSQFAPLTGGAAGATTTTTNPFGKTQPHSPYVSSFVEEGREVERDR